MIVDWGEWDEGSCAKEMAMIWYTRDGSSKRGSSRLVSILLLMQPYLGAVMWEEEG